MPELPVYPVVIAPEWIDYNGHLRDAYYVLAVSRATDAVMDTLGIDAAYRRESGCTLYTLELHLHYLHEVKQDDALQVSCSVLDFDRKRIHLGCRLTSGLRRTDAATAELMLLHVRQGDAPASTHLPDSIISRLQSYRASPSVRAAFGPSSRRISLTPH